MTGATGYIGARLVPKLLDEGHRVRALARTPKKLEDVPWRDRAEVAKGDLSDVDSLIEAFDDVDVVYYLVHSMGGSKDFAAEEDRAVRNVVTAAQRTGVRRIVYLGGLHPENADLSPHLESRKAVGDHLIESGIETVVLQAGVVIGSGSASFEMIRHLTDRLPVMTTPKWVHNKIQPIAVRDALHYLVEAATAAVPESRTWDIGGPDVLEYGDMMRTYAEVAGLHTRRLIVLPFLTPGIASLWVGTVTPIPSTLARPLIESLECDAVMRNSDVDSIIEPPPDGLIGYRRAVELALGRAARGLTEADWDSLSSEPADPLPGDPDWAGEISYTDVQTLATAAQPDDVRRAAELAAVDRGWQVAVRGPGRTVRLRGTRRAPGRDWLELTVEPRNGSGSVYTQRAAFIPIGIPGRVYWFAVRPARRAALRALLRDVQSRLTVVRHLTVVKPQTGEAVQAP